MYGATPVKDWVQMLGESHIRGGRLDMISDFYKKQEKQEAQERER